MSDVSSLRDFDSLADVKELAPDLFGEDSGEDVTRIESTEGWAALKLGEVWEYRELLYFFSWRDIKVRYKQTVLGVMWAIIQPFVTMVLFSFFFGRMAGVPSDGLPTPIFNYAALVPWYFFSNGVSKAANSTVSSQNLIKKVYFPRLTLPVASVCAGVVDFAVSSTVLLAMMFFYGIYPTGNVVWLPFLLVLAFAASLAVGIWLSALNVRFRDVRHAVPFLVQAWLFATPVAYPSSMLDEPWRTLYALNPMAGVVEGFRWALLGTDTQPGSMIIVSSAATVVLLVTSVFYFRRMERSFADVV